MSPGSNTESYPAFAHIGLRENPGKNLNQAICPDRESNPGHLVSRSDALTVTPQVWMELVIPRCYLERWEGIDLYLFPGGNRATHLGGNRATPPVIARWYLAKSGREFAIGLLEIRFEVGDNLDENPSVNQPSGNRTHD
ncbi:hypothetical protein ANN_21311 [Periplaneta americana]|uniref:Uncharacterized protein n=1 Tax=Periplaneta americana TaxID=6978 RepID=A0ABQ8SEZ5_PERAM|nr:hypothetical protein ANN_21311 [Periplaneta americana]